MGISIKLTANNLLYTLFHRPGNGLGTLVEEHRYIFKDVTSDIYIYSSKKERNLTLEKNPDYFYRINNIVKTMK